MTDPTDLAEASPPAVMPLPRLALRVGITGHRLDKLSPSDIGAIEEQLRILMAEVQAGLNRFHAGTTGRIYADGAPQIRLVTALAEGADRLAVDAAPASWALSALLPMPRDHYRDDFLPGGEETSPSADAYDAYLARAETVTELPMVRAPTGADPPRRSVQYAALGRALVRQVDCLIAVWDGKPPNGPGGTAAVVAEAMDLGLSILWIHPTHDSPPHQILGFRGGDVSRPELGPADGAAIDVMLGQLLGLDVGDGTPPANLVTPCARPSGWAIAYPALMRWAGAGRPTGRTFAERNWPPSDPLLSALEDQQLPGARSTIADLRRILMPRSYGADLLAWAHANLYRSAYVAAFLLAGLAVPLGLLATFADKGPHALSIKAVAVAIELAIVLFVAWLVMRGRKARWHANWIEARELSELLRVSRPLLMIGRTDDLFENTRLRDRPEESFPVWYARASLREIRPVTGVVDGTYLSRVLAITRDRLLKGQVIYHRSNIVKLSLVDRFLHHWGDRCFVATIAVLVGYLVLFLLSLVVPALEAFLTYLGKPFVSVLAASLPAFGAALAGIRAQGEFSNRVQQSERSLAALSMIADEIEVVLAEPPEAIIPDHAGDLVVAIARVMMDDVRHWRHVYVGKTLALPS